MKPQVVLLGFLLVGCAVRPPIEAPEFKKGQIVFVNGLQYVVESKKARKDTYWLKAANASVKAGYYEVETSKITPYRDERSVKH